MGSKGYSAGAHVVFKLVVHLVFVTKYRRKAITQRVFDVILHRARPNASIAAPTSTNTNAISTGLPPVARPPSAPRRRA